MNNTNDDQQKKQFSVLLVRIMLVKNCSSDYLLVKNPEYLRVTYCRFMIFLKLEEKLWVIQCAVTLPALL